MTRISRDEQTLYKLLSLIEDGHLVVVNPQGREFSFGQPGEWPTLRVLIRNPKTYKRILSATSLGIGESYMEGWWDEENDNLLDLAGLIFTNNIYSKLLGDFSLVLRLLVQRFSTSPVFLENSQENVKYHYGIGNDFYCSFLDQSLSYSCGYQLGHNDSIDDMQRQKHELICKKLSLSSQDNIIDIGCGWGGMLIYAAEKYGVSGTGVTLSQEQAQFATQKIQKRGLSQQLNIVVSDYREFTGQYDKFISMAMFEHVGKGNFSTFMEKASELLKPGGTGLLHTMGTTSAGRRAGRDAWIEKYIFPGGYLPKLHDLMYEMWRARLNIAHHENLRPHYPETLSRWSDKFQNNRDKIMALAPRYDERFMRMWNFYLQVCEANFRYGNVQVFQILFYKGKKWPFTTPFDFTIDP